MDELDLPARFEREGLARCRRGARFLCFFVAAMMLASAGYSFVFESGIFLPLLTVRLVGVAVSAILFVALGTPWGLRRSREVAIFFLAATAVAMHVMAQWSGGQASPQYDRMGLLVLAPAMLMSWNATWALLACAAIFGVYLGGSAAIGGIGTPEFAADFARMIGAGVASVAATFARERMRWRDASRVQALREARRHAEEEILRLNESLERRVQERTAELRASEARFRAMFEAAPIGVVTLDESDHLRQVNRAFAEMVGYEREALLGRGIEEITAPEHRKHFARALAELRAGSVGVFQAEKRYLTRAGQPIATHEAVAAIRDESGSFLYALGMVEDVSERARAEEKVRAHQEQLAHVLRLTTMGGMVTELAHELNQPLGAVVSFANGVVNRLSKGDSGEELIAAVKRIADEGMRAAEILRRIRDFVRPGGGSCETVDLNGVVRDAALLVGPDVRQLGIQLRLQLEPALPPVRLDRIQVEQVLLNLLRNAIEAMSGHPDGDHELLVLTARARGVEVQVRDTGSGVSREEAERIFDAFFTTKPGGLGMGLSISRSIVEAYGGQLWARPNPDRGMTFGFSLPDGAEADGITSRGTFS